MSDMIEIKCYEDMEKYKGSEVSAIVYGVYIEGYLYYRVDKGRYYILNNDESGYTNDGKNIYYKISEYNHYYWVFHDDFKGNDFEDFYVLDKKKSVLDYSWSMEGLTKEQSKHVQQIMFDNGIGWCYLEKKIQAFTTIQYKKEDKCLYSNSINNLIPFETFIKEFPMKGEEIIESQGVFLVKNNKGIQYDPQLHNCRCSSIPIENDPENWKELNNILNPTNKQELKILKPRRNSIITLPNINIEII